MRLPEILFSTAPAAILAVALLKATIALAIVQWIVASVRSLSAASRHLLLSFALSGFIVIPLVSLAFPRLSVSVRVPAERAIASEAPAPDIAVSQPAAGAKTIASRQEQRATPAAASPQLNTTTLIALIWLAGILVLLFRLGVAAVRLRSILRTASAAPPQIQSLVDEMREALRIRPGVRALVTDRIAVPMIWGVRSGTLLLPSVATEWQEEELHATVVHELGHLQRLDYVALAVMNLVASLFWFHPQVWTARRRALTEGEHACDDLVLRCGARASEYASHLLSVARLMPRREPLAAILAMSRPTQLEGRMYAILSPTINRNAVGGKLLMISALGFMLFVAPFATLQLSAEAPVQPVAVIAAAVPSMPDTPAEPQSAETHRHASHEDHSHNISSTGTTGTCADINHGFDTESTARGEENLTYSGNALDITASNGAVRVRRATGSTFAITVCKSAGGPNDGEAQQLLSQVRVQQSAGSVSASGPDGGHWSVDFIVTVPDSRTIRVKNENGPVSFSGVNATIEANVQNGPVSLRDSRGDIKAKTVNGPLTLSGASGNVDVATQNGPLTLTLDGQAWVGGELHARVGNGPLKLTVPEGYQTGIALQTGSHSPFHCSGSICGELANQNSRQPAAINTTLGSSPARIFVEGGNGPVNIKQGSTQQ